MEEDYLAWKDGMWESVQKTLGWEEGGGGDVADFEVKELSEEDVDHQKVFLGELSQRALSGSRGVYDAKNPYAAPLLSAKELFQDGDRNCVFAEFDIADSGIRYQTGDHVGVWPLNPDVEVERFLRVLGLDAKRDQPIDITSLDPALAKVPFPVPTTYDTVFRHYLDICSVASRQTVGALAKFAPTDSARGLLEKLGSNKEFYHEVVGEKCLKLAQVLILAAGDSLAADPTTATYTQWSIPFDRIISGTSRLQPRYYSISSSPKLFPNSIHVTAVVLKYKPHVDSNHVFGVGTNYLLNLQSAHAGEPVGLAELGPSYKLEGPRGKYKKETGFAAPIHVRRSNFRLPTSPKIPIIMIGPGTVRSFLFPFVRKHALTQFVAGCRSLPRLCPGARRSRAQGQGEGRSRRAQGLGNDRPLLRLPMLDVGLPLQGGVGGVRQGARWQVQDPHRLVARAGAEEGLRSAPHR